MNYGRATLTQFIIEEQRRANHASGDFSALLHDIATAVKSISHAISRGALDAADSAVEDRVAQSEFLTRAAAATIKKTNEWTGRLAAMAGMDEEEVYPVPTRYPRGKYLLLFNALNGSGNLDINFLTGTIFSVLRAPPGKKRVSAEDFLQTGAQQVAAGFALYGASTRLVLTTGNGVYGFTLDREIGEFILTQPALKIPDNAATFAINASNERFWEPPVRRYVEECMAGAKGPRGRDFGMRWVASLIAEAYRILMRGGVFLYPVDEKTREQGGRLGLLFEVNPIAWLIEQAGGAAITGRSRILDVQPTSLQQRAPFIFGTKSEVERIFAYHQEFIAGHDHASYDMPLFSTRSLFRAAQ